VHRKRPGDMKEDCCGMFRALSVDTRVRIIEILKTKGPLGTKGIGALLGVTPAAVSQHLKVLRQAGLVSSERKGYFIPYSLDPSGLRKCGHQIVAVCGCELKEPGHAARQQSCGSNLDALQAHKRELEQELAAVNRRLERAKRKGKR
jgi:DNA-binding transcriptional ArsR family regulator